MLTELKKKKKSPQIDKQAQKKPFKILTFTVSPDKFCSSFFFFNK